jgi:hypothetical protein
MYVSVGKLKGMDTHDNQRSVRTSKTEKTGIGQRNVWKEIGGWGPKLRSHEIAAEVVVVVVVIQEEE